MNGQHMIMYSPGRIVKNVKLIAIEFIFAPCILVISLIQHSKSLTKSRDGKYARIKFFAFLIPNFSEKGFISIYATSKNYLSITTPTLGITMKNRAALVDLITSIHEEFSIYHKK